MSHKKIQVAVIAQCNNKYYLLQLRTIPKNGSFWQNITGSVEEGEKYKQAAIRELQEETGIEIECVERFQALDYKIKFHDKWGRDVTEKAYCVLINDTIEIKICSKEHDEYKWIECSKVTKDNFKYPGNFEVFKLAWSAIC